MEKEEGRRRCQLALNLKGEEDVEEEEEEELCFIFNKVKKKKKIGRPNQLLILNHFKRRQNSRVCWLLLLVSLMEFREQNKSVTLFILLSGEVFFFLDELIM